MNKREYTQTNKDWLAAKAQDEGVKPLPKGIYYKVLAEGKADGKHPTPRSIVTAHGIGQCIDVGMTRQMIYHGDHGWTLT